MDQEQWIADRLKEYDEHMAKVRAEYIVALGAVAALLLPKTANAANKSFLGQSGLPRGMRNNNPGNIRINQFNNWLGKVTPNTDGAFEQFEKFKYGTRAMIRLIQNYINKGYNTPAKIIQRYAPPAENSTSDYISTIEIKSGLNRNAVISPLDQHKLHRLISAMAEVENGRSNVITKDDFYTAWDIL